MSLSYDPFTPPSAVTDISEPPESASWWLFHVILDDDERHIPVLTLRIPLVTGNPCTWCLDIRLWRSMDTFILLTEVKRAVDANPSAIWEDHHTQTRFWTVWSRNERFGVDDPAAYHEHMEHIKKQVLKASPTGTPVITVQNFLFPRDVRHAIKHLGHALASRDLVTVETGVQTHGPTCRQHLNYLNNCYDNNPVLRWLARHFVLKALDLNNDLDKPETISAAAQFQAWTAYFDATMNRLAIYDDVKAPLTPDLDATPPTSPTLTQRSALPKNENDYERDDAPNSRLPTSTHHPSQQSTSERNPALSFSPFMAPVDNVQVPASVVAQDNVDPHARIEIFYDREKPYARGVVTRLYQGFTLHSEPYQLAAVKVATVTGEDSCATLRAWARDEQIRALLKAHVITIGDIAFPLVGTSEVPENLPVSVSPWCGDGNLNQYVLAQRRRKPHRNPSGIVLDMMEELLRIMSILHGQEQPIVHGNLKASNILVPGGKLQLCDFGAYSADDWDPLAVAQHGIITHKSLPFVSPELFLSGRPTVYSDMWAISCIFVEVHLAALTPNHDFVTWTQGSIGPHPFPVSMGANLQELITVNWNLDPTRRLSAPSMLKRLCALRRGSRL
ncbi:kinase-like protein [Auricularia subglabra TFB-10046 SS5]|nr:kinase-like protein [Auricularia subglabra TFB-10046 SS5]